MAITLPDFTALPDQTPRAVGGVPSLPQEDAGAAGLATLGKGVSAAAGAVTDIAAYRQVHQNRMDEALATADFTNRIIPLSEQLKVETDPEKITALRGQFAQALQESSAAIGNPETRQLWLAKNQTHVAQGQADVDLRNMVVYRDRWKAGAAQTLEDLARTGAVATDPQAYEGNRLRIDQVTEAAVKSGAMPAAEAQAHNNKAKIDLTAGRIDAMTARGQFDDAAALLEQNRGDLGPVLAAHLEAGIQNKGTAVRTYGAGLRALGMGGGPSGEPLVPYTPAQDILSGTGLSADQYQTFRSHVAQREAGSYAQPPNKGGYMGRYQMGQDEIRETAGRLGVPVPSQQQFLSDPNLQERFFENYTLDHHNTLMEQSGQYRNASPTEKAAILMGAHLGGVGGVTSYLQGKGDPADANGTHVSDYVRSMGRAMAGGAQPGAAPGAPPSGAFEVWGDSLGVGLKGRLGGDGTVVGGARPTAIFDNIKKQPDSYWQGKTVVLPSGSNGNEMGVVEDTIRYLQDPKRGANVIAVGYGPKFPEKNAQLRDIAGRLNVPVIDAEGVDPGEGVHPSPRGYQTMADKIRAAVPAAAPAPAGPAPANIDLESPAGQAAPALAPPDTAAAPGAAPAAPLVPAAAGTAPTVQPIPTGQPPAPGAAPAPAVPPAPNRTGLPMPDEVAQRIWADPSLHNDKERAQAFAHAESIYRTSEAALAQQERIRTQAAQQQVRDAENEVYADVYSGTPKITPQQIAVDPRYNSNPERRKSMIELVNNPPGSGIPAPQSYLAAQQLIDRIRLPWGDPNKITTKDQIYDQMKIVNRADFDFVLKKYDELSSPGDHPFTTDVEHFLNGVRGQIDHSGELPGLPRDGRGKTKAYQFERFVQRQIDQYRRDNKNPDDLLNGNKPDYLGSDKTLKPYKRTLNEALADQTADQGGAAPGATPGTPGAPPDPEAAAKAALRAALENNLLSPEQAAAVAVQRGWARPPGAPAIAPPVR